MARKASFSSRSSYQKGYSLGNRGTASPGGGGAPSVKGEKTDLPSSGRTGGRRKGSGKDAGGGGGINISYSDVVPSGDLQTVADFGKGVKAGKTLGVGKAVDYAKVKGDQGSGFNLGKRR